MPHVWDRDRQIVYERAKEKEKKMLKVNERELID